MRIPDPRNDPFARPVEALEAERVDSVRRQEASKPPFAVRQEVWAAGFWWNERKGWRRFQPGTREVDPRSYTFGEALAIARGAGR